MRGELKLVDEQIERMRLIVTQLLQFARPGEYAGYVEAVDTARRPSTTAWCWSATCWRARGSPWCASGRATRRAAINRQELQQVLVNLLVNAIQAMPDGGTLALTTPRCRRVADRDRHRRQRARACRANWSRHCSSPFVTRKKDGTGLGLWISRSLVERYGGDIRARNREGSPGAVLTVALPAETQASGLPMTA